MLRTKELNFTELNKWRKDHPNEQLYPCANVGDVIHLDIGHQKEVKTACGLKDDPYYHRLIFSLPRHVIDCEDCLKHLAIPGEAKIIKRRKEEGYHLKLANGCIHHPHCPTCPFPDCIAKDGEF